MIYHGDCLDVMPTLEAESIDAVVTDPPYGLGFMGKHWDHGVPAIEFWQAMLRVSKPSAYLLAFGGTRTVHRMACAIEDAGWIIRDMLVWGYASGFPKSKASLKPAWEPIVMARKPGPLRMLAIDATRLPTGDRPTSQDGPRSTAAYSNGHTDPWHTDGLPDHNPGTLLRAWSAAQPEADSAPLANALADALDGRAPLDSPGGYPSCRRCGDGLARIAAAVGLVDVPPRHGVHGAHPFQEWSASRIRESRCADHLSIWDELVRVGAGERVLPYGNDTSSGRWPANIILTDPIFDGGIEGVVGGGETTSGDPAGAMRNDLGWFGEGSHPVPLSGYGDSGTYSRFFLVPKADRLDREPAIKPAYSGGAPDRTDGLSERLRTVTLRTNQHPTVKPTELMRHLVRLVTPRGGTVLDPFLGSGTTGLAAEMEGFDWIGIEREAEYVAIAKARLNGTQQGMAL